jgi:Zn-dependent protease
MLGSEPQVRFRIFGVQVEVGLFFLLVVVILGQGSTRGSLVLLGAWVVIAFASVLLHELGHALTARAFGQQPFVSLYGLGGITRWRQRRELSAGERLVVSATGPALGIVVGVPTLIVYLSLGDRTTTAALLLAFVVYANLVWAVLNLLPMLPFDGGHVTSALVDMVAPGRGPRAARYVSIVTALLVAPLAFASGRFLLMLYCGFVLWMNIQDLRGPTAAPPPSSAVIDVPAQPLPPDDARPPRQT